MVTSLIKILLWLPIALMTKSKLFFVVNEALPHFKHSFFPVAHSALVLTGGLYVLGHAKCFPADGSRTVSSACALLF